MRLVALREETYLEATCGDEFSVPHGVVAPADTVCPEHGRVGLWAERLEPATADPRPLPGRHV